MGLKVSSSVAKFTLLRMKGCSRGVFGQKKSTVTGKCRYVLVSLPQSNDLCDRLQCIKCSIFTVIFFAVLQNTTAGEASSR